VRLDQRLISVELLGKVGKSEFPWKNPRGFKLRSQGRSPRLGYLFGLSGGFLLGRTFGWRLRRLWLLGGEVQTVRDLHLQRVQQARMTTPGLLFGFGQQVAEGNEHEDDQAMEAGRQQHPAPGRIAGEEKLLKEFQLWYWLRFRGSETTGH
jgi:hypothetical protein